MNRRVFLETAAAAPFASAQGRRPPNVVFVLADQWRAQAFGYAGDPNARTPAIDGLAAESVNFRNAVSGFPVCSPYRASLMTGQYAVNNGLVVNDVPLKPNGPTLAESFRKSGYETAYIGKWHLFGSPEGKAERRLSFVPKDARFGFDYWKACECTHNYNRSLYYEGDDRQARFWEGYDAVGQTADACEFIRKRKSSNDPYFLLLSFGPPHDPYGTAPDEYKARYAEKQIHLRPNVPEFKAERAVGDLRGYYAHTAALDDCVKRVREVVDDRTILVFTSDHGDMLQSQGLPLKQFPWDESIRVPFLIRFPRAWNVKRCMVDTVLDAPDIMPTLLGACGLRIPESVEGRDYSKIAAGKEGEDAGSAALLNVPASFSVIRRHGCAEYRGLRTRRYTFVRSIHGPWLLYDNQEDPYQKNNLIGNPRRRDLQARLERTLDQRLKAARDDFLPGRSYVERAHAQHYREVNAEVGSAKSPWGDWQSTWR
ncbi:MAG: sulfatase [Bryobacteraceae bacterium]